MRMAHENLRLVEPGAILRAIKHDGRLDYSTAYGILATVPSMECEPVRYERWLDVENSYYEVRVGDHVWKRRVCTGCGAGTIAPSSDQRLEGRTGNVFYRYCPTCGAKMDFKFEGEQ